MFQWQLTRVMQRSLEYYCSRAPVEWSSSAKPPIMLTFERKKRPVCRPRKTAAAKHETCQPRPTLVDYSSTASENEESSNDPPVATKKRLHRMYSQSQKKMVAYYARQNGIRKAETHYGIHHRNVQRWVKDQVTALKNPRTRANKKGHGQKISYPEELEDHLVSWILQKWEEQFIAVSTQLIRLKALSLIKDINPNFKASDGWVRKF